MRAVRVADELWKAARVKAAAQGTTVGVVIVRLLTEWVDS